MKSMKEIDSPEFDWDEKIESNKLILYHLGIIDPHKDISFEDDE